MRSSRCAFNAAVALHGVFIAPIEHTTLRTLRPQTLPSSMHLLQSRRYASAKTELPRDNAILAKYKYVHIVEEDGRLSEPRSVSNILDSLDRKTHSLITVALPGQNIAPRAAQTLDAPDDDSIKVSMEQSALAEVASQNPAPNDDGPLLPICKLVSRKVEKTKQIAKKTEKKVNPSLTLKTVELNWAIDPHDLSHRIERIREFLRKGFRVDVLMAPKRKGRKAEEQEAREVLRKVREVVDSVEGAKEWKGLEGKVGGTATVYLEGKSI